MLMSGFHVPLITTSQLTIFGPWKHVDSMLQPWGQSWTTRITLPCTPPSAIVIARNHTTLYLNFWEIIMDGDPGLCQDY